VRQLLRCEALQLCAALPVGCGDSEQGQQAKQDEGLGGSHNATEVEKDAARLSRCVVTSSDHVPYSTQGGVHCTKHPTPDVR
jgi:hypothetical protein